MKPTIDLRSRVHQSTNRHEEASPTIPDAPDAFVALPRNCDTAVVYWSIDGLPETQSDAHATRLCLQINGKESNAEECIFLHRESGHFIVPLLADDRNYEINLGWSDSSGFHPISSQSVQLPDHAEGTLGAMSSSLSYRGAHFWPKNTDTSVN